MPTAIPTADCTTMPDPRASRDRRWQGRWIWPADGDEQQANSVALFRAVLRLDAPGLGHRLLISALSQYRLWIDGAVIADGPPPSADHRTYYDGHALDDLAAGDHLVAILVRVGDLSWPQRGGLLFEVVAADGSVVLASGAEQVVAVPGRAWRNDCYRFAMNKLAAYQEHCDGRLVPAGWHDQPVLAGQAWPAARELGGARGRPVPPTLPPWSHLAPRPILPLERQVFVPATVVAREHCQRVLNRCESHDASIEAAQPGLPDVDGDFCVDAEALCRGEDACELRCSQPLPEDPAWDGTRDPALTLGFDEELTAFIEIDISAPEGAVIFIASAERLIDGRLNHTLEGRFTERYVCRAGRQQFRSLHWRAFRYLRVRVADATAPVRVHALRAIRVRTPFPAEGRSQLPASWQAIDELCRRTVRLCCVDGIFDTPWREAAQWLGDVAMASLPALHWCYGDTALSGKFLVQSGGNALSEGILSNLSNRPPHAGPATIPDYSLWWLYGLREHRWYTGDDGWYRALYPEAVRILRWHEQHLDEAGFLSDLPHWVFIDWAAVCKQGCSSTNNAIFAMACDVVAEMATVIGDQHQCDHAAALAARIRHGFADRFWDAERTAVIDAVVDGEPVDRLSEHAQAAAVLFGCLDDERCTAVIEATWVARRHADLVECQPFFTRIVLEALSAHGRRDLALALIEERWGRRFRDRGWDTCLEEWTCNGSWRTGAWSPIQRTTSHAWSAAAGEYFARRLPGIQLLEPGAGRIRVDVQRTDFPWQVSVPLPQGPLAIAHRPGREPTITPPPGVVIVAA